jgi:hypothetical protein
MKVEEFISKLFAARIDMHVAHLQTAKYSDHMALNDFYNGIPDLTDRFVECYQGKYGIVTRYETAYTEGVDPLKYLNDFSKDCEDYRTACTDGYLQQIIDDILELTYSTIYKIKYLKK